MFALRHKETKNFMCIDTQWDCFGSTEVLEEHAENVFVVSERSLLEALIEDFNAGTNAFSLNFPVVADPEAFVMYEIVELTVK
ncbi:hypothetical protein EJP02_477 [Escherichia phage EJP2]|nr:hypothetical protein EJP02_477 [Escherichia phage EJP2]